MVDERREFTRFELTKDEIQVLSDDPILFGQLSDISKGGLSFQYTPIPGIKMATCSINILPKDNYNFNIYHINCKIIYDMPIAKIGNSITGYNKRKCGIKYSWLKEKQNNKLELLLYRYIVKCGKNTL
jgi:hypothetical protein